jgi:hypothetical protein
LGKKCPFSKVFIEYENNHYRKTGIIPKKKVGGN